MEGKAKKIIITLLLIITLLILFQTTLILLVFRKVDSAYKLQKTYMGLNSNSINTSTLEPSPNPTNTITPFKTESIINACIISSTPQPEIWNNLDASYYYFFKENIRICGQIADYSIVSLSEDYFAIRNGKVLITLEKKEGVNFPVDVYINIPADINKNLYKFFENNINKTICFSGKAIYVSDSKTVYDLENSEDLCIPQ